MQLESCIRVQNEHIVTVRYLVYWRCLTKTNAGQLAMIDWPRIVCANYLAVESGWLLIIALDTVSHTHKTLCIVMDVNNKRQTCLILVFVMVVWNSLCLILGKLSCHEWGGVLTVNSANPCHWALIKVYCIYCLELQEGPSIARVGRSGIFNISTIVYLMVVLFLVTVSRLLS